MGNGLALHKIRLESTKVNDETAHRRVIWARALRSNSYLRGQWQLRSLAGTFCPLGVATDVYHKETKHGKWDKYDRGYSFNGTRYFLPQAAVDFYQINRAGAFYIPNDENVHSIIEMSDSRGWTFDDIANLLDDPRIVWLP